MSVLINVHIENQSKALCDAGGRRWPSGLRRAGAFFARHAATALPPGVRPKRGALVLHSLPMPQDPLPETAR